MGAKVNQYKYHTRPPGVYISYLRLIWWARRRFGIKAYGIGWMASKVSRDFHFIFKGVPFIFSTLAARSYCLLPAGIANEPETHAFLDKALSFVPGVVFIDIGASIGEFAIPMAHDVRVKKVLAFEPHPASNTALRVSAHLVC